MHHVEVPSSCISMWGEDNLMMGRMVGAWHLLGRSCRSLSIPAQCESLIVWNHQSVLSFCRVSVEGTQASVACLVLRGAGAECSIFQVR